MRSIVCEAAAIISIEFLGLRDFIFITVNENLQIKNQLSQNWTPFLKHHGIRVRMDFLKLIIVLMCKIDIIW